MLFDLQPDRQRRQPRDRDQQRNHDFLHPADDGYRTMGDRLPLRNPARGRNRDFVFQRVAGETLSGRLRGTADRFFPRRDRDFVKKFFR